MKRTQTSSDSSSAICRSEPPGGGRSLESSRNTYEPSTMQAYSRRFVYTPGDSEPELKLMRDCAIPRLRASRVRLAHCEDRFDALDACPFAPHVAHRRLQ